MAGQRTDGQVAGSVSGGCVEGAVVEASLEVLATGVGKRVEFGYSDADAFAVGLTCGGEIGIFISPQIFAFHDELAAALRSGTPVAVATVVGAEEVEDGAASPPRSSRSSTAPMSSTSDARKGRREITVASALLVRADGSSVGSLGHPSLDRSVDARRLLRSALCRAGARSGPTGRAVRRAGWRSRCSSTPSRPRPRW